MLTWYCRECGEECELSECPKASRAKFGFLGWRRCPACGGRIAVSGGAVIALGMLLALFMGLFMEERMGLIVGGPIAVLGVLRLLRQRRVSRRKKSGMDS